MCSSDLHKVALLSKASLNEGSTRWAQGGIATVVDPEDSLAAHIEDTLVAGAGLCHQDAVELVVNNSRQSIQWLIDQGVPFTPAEITQSTEHSESSSPLSYHLTREGGHSFRRILHADDATGLAISETLTARVRQHTNICVFENYLAIDLITRHKLGLAGQAMSIFDMISIQGKSFALILYLISLYVSLYNCLNSPPP